VKALRTTIQKSSFDPMYYPIEYLLRPGVVIRNSDIFSGSLLSRKPFLNRYSKPFLGFSLNKMIALSMLFLS